MMGRCGLRPLRSYSIPQPRVSQVICSIKPAEEHYLVSDTVVRHLRGSASRRRSVRCDLGPGNAVECPGVIQKSVIALTAVKDDLVVVWIVSHCSVVPRRRLMLRLQLGPRRAVETPRIIQQSIRCGVGVAAEKDVACCYARSDKYWVTDPAGVAWESFRSLGSVPFYRGKAQEPKEEASCCGPRAVDEARAACC